MRKLRKSNLDELAEKLPVLDQKETLECVGGDHYFDHSGNFLGETGPGQDIRITSYSTFQNNWYNPTLLAYTSTKPNETLGFYELTRLASHYAKPLLGTDTNNIIIYSGIYINGQFNNTHPAAFNGTTLFVNDWGWNTNKMPFNNYVDLNNALIYARAGSGYVPGQTISRS